MGYRRQSPQPVIEGGTGTQSNTSYAVLCGGTTPTNPIQSIASVGTAGQLLTSNGAGALPTFQALAGTIVRTLTGNSGGAVPAAAGNINVVGTGTIAVAGSAGTNTLTISAGATIPTSFVTDSGTAIPSANIINIRANPTAQTCGKTVQFTGSSNTVQLNVSDGSGNTLVGFGAGGAVLTGVQNTGFGYGAANSVSSGNRNTAVGYLAANTLTSGNNNTIIGESAAEIMTTASNNTIIGSNAASNVTTGASNIAIGQNAGDSLTTNNSNTLIGTTGTAGTTQFFAIAAGSSGAVFMHNYPGVSSITSVTGGNLFFGRDAGDFTLTGATLAGNNAFGESSLNTITSGSENNSYGCFSLGSLTTGTRNSAFGNNAGSLFDSGSYNTFLGDASGANFSSNESSNICINSPGEVGDSNTLRIGNDSGIGPRNLTRAFIHGIRDVTPSAGDAIPVVIDSNGQLGTEGGGGSGPAFLAYLDISQSIANSTLTQVNFDSILVNRDSAYNAGTSTFTAPETGLYNFNVGISLSGSGGASASGFAQLTTTSGNYLINYSTYTSLRTSAVDPIRLQISGATYISLDAGDTVIVESNINWGGSGYSAVGFTDAGGTFCTYFGGTLI